MFSHQVAVLYFSATSAPTTTELKGFHFNSSSLSPTFSLAAFFVSESIQLIYFRLSSNAHLIFATISSTWERRNRRKSEARHLTQQEQRLWALDFEALTKALLSSAKVSLTNMAPRAKPRALSVSLTQSFQRGVQLCNIRRTHRDMLKKNASSQSADNITVVVGVRPISDALSHFLLFPEWMWVTPQNMGGLVTLQKWGNSESKHSILINCDVSCKLTHVLLRLTQCMLGYPPCILFLSPDFL